MNQFDPYSYPLEPAWFERPHSLHGLSHTRRVLIHACAIAPAIGLDELEFEALVAAAAWHDIGRTHDGWDPAHGAGSVAKMRELGLGAGLPPEILARVAFSVELHSLHDAKAMRQAESVQEKDSFLRVLWALKDADGLDRVRIWDLDARRLRHPVSREREAEAWRLLEALP